MEGQEQESIPCLERTRNSKSCCTTLPFLDLSSPMTPYEWFKFFVMVGCLSTHLCCCHLLCTSAIIFCSCHHPSGTMKLEHRWLFVARQEPHLLLVHCPRMQSCD